MEVPQGEQAHEALSLAPNRLQCAYRREAFRKMWLSRRAWRPRPYAMTMATRMRLWSGLLRRALRAGRAARLASGAILVLLLVRTWPAVGAEPVVEVFDLHVDVPYQVNFRGRLWERGSGQFVLDWLSDAGMAGVVFPLFVPSDAEGGRTFDAFERSYHRMARALASDPRFALQPCAPAPGRVAAFYSFEGMDPFARAPESLPLWIARGVRLFGLVHSSNNALATSATGLSPSAKGESPLAADVGLTREGKAVARRIVELGGVLDASHASDAAFADLLAIAHAAGRPLVASHSNFRALASHPRNLTDDQARSIAATGGIVGINFHSRFLRGDGKRAHLDDVVRHISHAVRTLGVDHVALGSDFEGDIRPPFELADVRGYQRLAQALRGAGLAEPAIRQVLGSNARRVLCAPSTANAPASRASGVH